MGEIKKNYWEIEEITRDNTVEFRGANATSFEMEWSCWKSLYQGTKMMIITTVWWLDNEIYIHSYDDNEEDDKGELDLQLWLILLQVSEV